MTDLYPVTIVKSRYGGTYEGATWLAFNLEMNQVPPEVTGTDVECSEFFASTQLVIGRGDSPDTSYTALAALTGGSTQ
jgi:hypothetical protein